MSLKTLFFSGLAAQMWWSLIGCCSLCTSCAFQYPTTTITPKSRREAGWTPLETKAERDAGRLSPPFVPRCCLPPTSRPENEEDGGIMLS